MTNVTEDMMRIFFNFIILIIILLPAANQSDARPFHLAGDEDEAPFGKINENNEIEGIFIDIITEAFKRMGIPVQYSAYPWKRAQLLVKKGEADGMITVVTSERLTYVLPSQESLVKVEFCVFAKKNNPKIDQIMNAEALSDLKDLKVIDYIGDGWGERNLSDLNVERGGSLSSAIKRLSVGRGDVFIQPRISTKYTIKQLKQDPKNKGLPLDMIIDTPHSMESNDFRLMIGKKSSFLTVLPKFDATIKVMREDNTLQQIYKKYTTY